MSHLPALGGPLLELAAIEGGSEASQLAEIHRHMALARKSYFGSDLCNRPIASNQQLSRSVNAPLDNVTMRRNARGGLKGLTEMIRAQASQTCEFGKPQVVVETIIYIVLNLPQLGGCQSTGNMPQLVKVSTKGTE